MRKAVLPVCPRSHGLATRAAPTVPRYVQSSSRSRIAKTETTTAAPQSGSIAMPLAVLAAAA